MTAAAAAVLAVSSPEEAGLLSVLPAGLLTAGASTDLVTGTRTEVSDEKTDAQSLDDFTQMLRDEGYLAGVAHLGTVQEGGGYEAAHALIESSGYAGKYPFLSDITQYSFIRTDGCEVYALIPADTTTNIVISEWLTGEALQTYLEETGLPGYLYDEETALYPDADDQYNYGMSGEVLYWSQRAYPLLLLCNTTPETANMNAEIAAADEPLIELQLRPNLQEGVLSAPGVQEKILDFTICDEPDDEEAGAEAADAASQEEETESVSEGAADTEEIEAYEPGYVIMPAVVEAVPVTGEAAGSETGAFITEVTGADTGDADADAAEDMEAEDAAAQAEGTGDELTSGSEEPADYNTDYLDDVVDDVSDEEADLVGSGLPSEDDGNVPESEGGSEGDLYPAEGLTQQTEGSSTFADTLDQTVDSHFTYALATSELTSADGRTYAAGQVLDRDPSTCWSEGADGTGTGESIMLYADQLTAVQGIWLLNGDTSSARAYTGNGKVTNLRIELSDGTLLDANLGAAGVVWNTVPDGLVMDSAWEYMADISFGGAYTVEWIRITITGATAGSASANTCLSEIYVY